MIPYPPVNGDPGTSFDHLHPTSHHRGCGGRWPRSCSPSRACVEDMSHGDLVRGRPPLLPAPSAGPDLLRDRVAGGDDGLRLGPVDRAPVHVADHVRGAPGHGGPEPAGEVRRHHAERLVVVGPPLHHLDPVDPGELRIELPRGVGRPDEHPPQPAVAGLRHGLALAVGLPGLRGTGDEPRVGGVAVPGGEPSGPPGEGHPERRSHPGDAGERSGEPGGVDLPVGLLPAALQGPEGGLGHLEPADLRGELLGQDLEGDRPGVPVEGHGLLGGAEVGPGLGPAVLPPGGPGDERGEALEPQFQQLTGVAVAPEDLEVGPTDRLGDGLADEGHGRAGEVPDPALVAGDLLGEALGGPDQAVERCGLPGGELELVQRAPVPHRELGQDLGAGAVRLPPPGEGPAQVGGPRGVGAEHPVAPAGEEHRHREPRRPRRGSYMRRGRGTVSTERARRGGWR